MELEKLEKKYGVWIRPKEFWLLFPEINNYRSITRKYQGIKESLGKEKHHTLTVYDVADWLGLPAQKIFQIVHDLK